MIKKELKLGKVVLVTNHIEPLPEADALMFSQSLHFEKQMEHRVENDELRNYINRYVVEEELKAAAFAVYRQERDNSYEEKWKVDLVKAIKRSSSAQHFREEWAKMTCASRPNSAGPDACFHELMLKDAQEELTYFDSVLAHWRSGLSIRVGENHAVFLSTIFDNQHMQMPSTCKVIKDPPSLTRLATQFEAFCKCIFRNLTGSEASGLLKPLIQFSMGLACVLYFSNELGLFEWHLLGCERMQGMARVVCSGSDRNLDFVPEVLSVYHMQLLLTLYAYYSERYTQKECLGGESHEWKTKMAIIRDEIRAEC